MIPEAWQTLSPLERDTLLTLKANDPMIGWDINQHLGRPDTHRNKITDALARLETHGYITREPAEDRPGNAQRNALTPEGRALVEQVAEAIQHE